MKISRADSCPLSEKLMDLFSLLASAGYIWSIHFFVDNHYPLDIRWICQGMLNMLRYKFNIKNIFHVTLFLKLSIQLFVKTFAHNSFLLVLCQQWFFERYDEANWLF